MDITNQGIQNQNTVRINQYAADNKTVPVSGQEAKSLFLNNLEPGSYVYGQVQNTSTDGALLLLENGQTLLAKLADGVNLMPGQNMTFQVESKQDGTVYLKPMFPQAALEATAKKALAGAGFTQTPKNLEIVRELLELQMPVDKKTIQATLRNVTMNPDVPIKYIALMEKLELPVTREMVEQFQQYQNNQHQLSQQLGDILEELGDTANQLLNQGKEGEALELQQKMLDVLMQTPPGEEESLEPGANEIKPPTEGVVQSGLDGGVQTMATDNSSFAGESAGQISSENAGQVPGENADRISGENAGQILGENANQVPGEQAGRTSEGNTEAGTAGRLAAADTAAEDGAGSTQTLTANGNTAVLEKDASAVIGQEGQLSQKQGEAVQRADVLLNEVSGKMEALEKEGASVQEQLKVLREALSQLESPEEIKAVLGHKKYGRLLEKGMRDVWLIKPEEFADKEKLNRTYDRIEQQSRELGQILRETLAGESGAGRTAANVQNNLEFMQELNHVFPYLQIPLQMAEESAHGDLYVFADKKKLREKGDELSAFLHLSMEHLGDVDVYLKLKESRVSTDIMLEKKEVLNLFEKHIDELTGRLQEKGYSVETSLKIGVKEVDFAEDILMKNAGSGSVNRFSFDVKA